MNKNKIEDIRKIIKEGYCCSIKGELENVLNIVETMNDALHHIQIISSTMDDNGQVNEIFSIADKAQLD